MFTSIISDFLNQKVIPPARDGLNFQAYQIAKARTQKVILKEVEERRGIIHLNPYPYNLLTQQFDHCFHFLYFFSETDTESYVKNKIQSKFAFFEYVIFENQEGNKSISEIRHFHIFVKFNYSILLPGSTPSKKNGKRWTGKFLISSKAFIEYEALILPKLKKHAPEFIKTAKPLQVLSMYFEKPAWTRCDYSNMIDSIQDILVKAELLPDDNYKVIEPAVIGFCKNANPKCLIAI